MLRLGTQVISGLALADANYEEAIVLLEKRFANRQTSHMEALTAIPKPKSIHETKRLRNLYDSVGAHVRWLKSLEISQEMCGCFLAPIILQKLPEEFRIGITRKFTFETWILGDILSSSKESYS